MMSYTPTPYVFGERPAKTPPKSRWRILGEVFEALTKSEARSLAKRHFKLPRLPTGTVVEYLPAA